MPLDPSIQVSQSAISPSVVTITDNSSGSDVSIVARRVFVSDAYGNYLTGNGTVNYTEWPLVQTSISLDILLQDTAVNILVNWVDVSGNTVETYNNNYPLSQFGKQFFFYLIQQQGLQPSTYQDSNYSGNLAIFWSNIVGGDNAVSYGNSIAAAQECYNREILMQQNESMYF